MLLCYVCGERFPEGVWFVGLAPFNGDVIARPVVFAFAAQLGNSVTQVCETIGMEVAHAYGLDHGYLCSDVMTYLRPCGPKKFVDKDVRCGEGKARWWPALCSAAS